MFKRAIPWQSGMVGSLELGLIQILEKAWLLAKLGRNCGNRERRITIEGDMAKGNGFVDEVYQDMEFEMGLSLAPPLFCAFRVRSVAYAGNCLDMTYLIIESSIAVLLNSATHFVMFRFFLYSRQPDLQ